MRRGAVLPALTALTALTARTSTALTAQTAPTAADSAGIRQAALDYIEGYYDGDAARMERAVHPELAKRIVRTNEQGHSQLGQMSAMTLVQGTRAGGGKDTPMADRPKDGTFLDTDQNERGASIYGPGRAEYR